MRPVATAFSLGGFLVSIAVRNELPWRIRVLVRNMESFNCNPRTGRAVSCARAFWLMPEAKRDGGRYGDAWSEAASAVGSQSTIVQTRGQPDVCQLIENHRRSRFRQRSFASSQEGAAPSVMDGLKPVVLSNYMLITRRTRQRRRNLAYEWSAIHGRRRRRRDRLRSFAPGQTMS